MCSPIYKTELTLISGVVRGVSGTSVQSYRLLAYASSEYCRPDRLQLQI